jgi:adenylate kinase family enzyme
MNLFGNPATSFAIMGNAGSGKSTLACWLAHQIDAEVLDLDTVAWAEGAEVVRRAEVESRQVVSAFCRAHGRWIVEGCYSSLISEALLFTPKLIFLNPGEEQCLANCRCRPWEAHKYDTSERQDEHLPMLLDWVRGYYTRGDELSVTAHRACFDDYRGPKMEFNSQPNLDSPLHGLLNGTLCCGATPVSQSSSEKKLSP